jgi:hypothetical protein
MGAITIWSAATRFISARMLTRPLGCVLGPEEECVKERRGKRRSRKAFHFPMNGPVIRGSDVQHERRVVIRTYHDAKGEETSCSCGVILPTFAFLFPLELK